MQDPGAGARASGLPASEAAPPPSELRLEPRSIAAQQHRSRRPPPPPPTAPAMTGTRLLPRGRGAGPGPGPAANVGCETSVMPETAARAVPELRRDATRVADALAELRPDSAADSTPAHRSERALRTVGSDDRFGLKDPHLRRRRSLRRR